MIQEIDEVWIVLDALDECHKRNGTHTEGLLPWIKRLHYTPGNAHLLVTSRQEEDIKSALSEWARSEDMMHIQSKLVTNDIQGYIYARVREGNGLRRWRSRPKVQEEIETKLMKKAEGM